MNKLLDKKKDTLNTLSTEVKNIRHINRIKEQNEINRINNVHIGMITDMVIKPQKVSKMENLNVIMEQKENDYKKELPIYWKERTNVIYKKITDGETGYVRKVDDLIMHRVTKNDKNQKEILEKYENLKGTISEQNKNLQEIYSEKEQSNHKRKFEYSYRLKNMKKYNPSGFKEMKNASKEEENIENNINKENMINQLVSNGIFNDDELKMFGITL